MKKNTRSKSRIGKAQGKNDKSHRVGMIVCGFGRPISKILSIGIYLKNISKVVRSVSIRFSSSRFFNQKNASSDICLIGFLDRSRRRKEVNPTKLSLFKYPISLKFNSR